MSTHFGPEAQHHPVPERWGWSSHDLTVVAVWLEICAVIVIWLS
jgi:hypothetical protein